MTAKGYRRPRYQLSDGGRNAHAPHEKNDCTVRALVNACGMSYAEAHKVMKEAGRRARGGGRMWAGLAILAERSGWRFQKETITYPWPTLAAWLRQHPSGVWILSTANHCLAVRNGTVLDSFRVGMRYRVKTAWRVDYVAESVDARHPDPAQCATKGRKP